MKELAQGLTGGKLGRWLGFASKASQPARPEWPPPHLSVESMCLSLLPRLSHATSGSPRKPGPVVNHQAGQGGDGTPKGGSDTCVPPLPASPVPIPAPCDSPPGKRKPLHNSKRYHRFKPGNPQFLNLSELKTFLLDTSEWEESPARRRFASGRGD